MAHISESYRELLDRSMPKPVVGDGYEVGVRSRSGVRYREGEKVITMFTDLVENTPECVNASAIKGWLSKRCGSSCLGVYMEDPLRWDNDDSTDLEPTHAAEIVQRVEKALHERTWCFSLKRGPNQQHTPSEKGSDWKTWSKLR